MQWLEDGKHDAGRRDNDKHPRGARLPHHRRHSFNSYIRGANENIVRMSERWRLEECQSHALGLHDGQYYWLVGLQLCDLGHLCL